MGFPILPPVTTSTPNTTAEAVAWDADSDFGEIEGNVIGGDWDPAGFGGPGPRGPTGGGGPGGGASFTGESGAGPDFGAGAGIASGGAAGALGIGPRNRGGGGASGGRGGNIASTDAPGGTLISDSSPLAATGPVPPPSAPVSCSSSFSSNPVRYANGEILLIAQDIENDSFGQNWGHTRSYTNRLNGTADLKQNRNGEHWFVKETPQLAKDESGNIAVVGIVQETRWFDLSDDIYVPRFFFPERLTKDGSGTEEQFKYVDRSGNRFLFFGFDEAIPDARRGQFKGLIDAYGHRSLAVYDDATDQLMSFSLPSTVPGSSSSSNTTGASHYAYAYLEEEDDNAGRLSSVTRSLNGAPVERAEYTYFVDGDAGGSTGDLKTISRFRWQGDWVPYDPTHYRYYHDGDENGFEHGLKYVIGQEAYHRMMAAGLVPETAEETQLAQYADFYFEYDSEQRVTKEVTRAGGAVSNFEYETPAGNTGYNEWCFKTTETFSDGNKKWIVYTNAAGNIFFKKLLTSLDQPLEYVYLNYDETPGAIGAQTLRASSAAVNVSGFNESHADLGLSLFSTQGMVWNFNWYHVDDSGSGEYAGELESTSVRHGSSGTPALLDEYTYQEITASGDVRRLVAKYTVYRTASSGGLDPIETDYEYTVNAELQVGQLVVTLPVISTAQNGSNAANTQTYLYSEFGLPTWTLDERGMITFYKFDLETGGMLQEIVDVDTSLVDNVPDGWATLGDSNFGKHLISDFKVDPFGRTTEGLGPVHTIDLCGTATKVRRARWDVYQDAQLEQWTGMGYLILDTGAVTINPVKITRFDHADRTTEIILAIKNGAGPLLASDELGCHVRRYKTTYDVKGRISGQLTYFAIPVVGEGLLGINYLQTSYGYDSGFRPVRVVAPDGTISRTVYDAKGRNIEEWIGTNDVGATSSDPSGGGATGNNMSKVVAYKYDGSSSVTTKDNLVTTETRWTDDSHSRVVNFTYDNRNRLDERRADLGASNLLIFKYSYNNLDWVEKIEVFAGADSSSSHRVAQREMIYDDLGRMFRFWRRGVDLLSSPGTPTDDATSLRDELWYDASGNVAKMLRRGRRSFEKYVYDGPGRMILQYYCFDLSEYNSPTYSAAFDVVGDTVMHQEEWLYDPASNLTQTTTRERFHNASGTGALGDVATEPRARISYKAWYPDPLGRLVASLDVGTNGAAEFHRAEVRPPCTDTALVSLWRFNERGESHESTDPRGIVTLRELDDAGRLVRTIENYVPGGGGSDANYTVSYSYDSAGRLALCTVLSSATGNQVTRFAYGTAKSSTDSDFACNYLVKAMIYPNSDDTSSPLGDGGDDTYNRVTFRYNRQAEVKEKKDPAGTTHSYDYDLLGRWTRDRVTALAPGVDSTILRIERTFEPRGRVQNLTSHSLATVGSGDEVSDVLRWYNSYRQLSVEFQSTSGAAGSGSYAVVYGYSSGNNTVRRTAMYYPAVYSDGPTFGVVYQYGTDDEMNDMLSRPQVIKEFDTVITDTLATYSYLGWERRINVNYPEPSMDFTMLPVGSETATGDAGDQYIGLDRFGRSQEIRYHVAASGGGSAFDAGRAQYGFDRAGNRTWRRDAAASDSDKRDESYSYDGLSRITRLQRGVLNQNRTAIGGVPSFEEQFRYDSLGNWHSAESASQGAYVRKVDGAVTADQNRLHNTSNEITTITYNVDSWTGPILSDATGNITQTPSALDPEDRSVVCKYDAWNRLISLTDSGETEVGLYAYDAVGRRYQADSKSFFYSDQWQILETYTDVLRGRFVWGLRYPDDVIADLAADPFTKFYVVHDHQNVTNLVGVTSDGPTFSGTPFIYSAFGYPGPASWQFGFGVGYYDSDPIDPVKTGLYLMRYRFLHPKLGRWLTKDPIGYSAGNNLFIYCNSMPTTVADPTGLSPGTLHPNPPIPNWHMPPSGIRGGGIMTGRQKAQCACAKRGGTLMSRALCYYPGPTVNPLGPVGACAAAVTAGWLPLGVGAVGVWGSGPAGWFAGATGFLLALAYCNEDVCCIGGQAG